MNKLLVKLIKNKKNGQIHVSIPKKKLKGDLKDKIKIASKAWINLEDFE